MTIYRRADISKLEILVREIEVTKRETVQENHISARNEPNESSCSSFTREEDSLRYDERR